MFSTKSSKTPISVEQLEKIMKNEEAPIEVDKLIEETLKMSQISREEESIPLENLPSSEDLTKEELEELVIIPKREIEEKERKEEEDWVDEEESGTLGELGKDLRGSSALWELSSLFSKVFEDVNAIQIDFWVGLWLLSTQYTVPPPKVVHRFETNSKMLKKVSLEGFRGMRLASASYGWKIQAWYLNNPTAVSVDENTINRRCLTRHTGIPAKDIIVTHWKSGGFGKPAHYIAVDHHNKAIVFTIRGTINVISDILTDLIGNYTTFLDGKAHQGMKISAEKLYKLHFSHVLSPLLEEYPDYQLQLFGHSLGAGTAALLATLIKSKHPEINLHCWAFAPPPVMSKNLAKRSREFITSYIRGDDIVPRLCLGAMVDLKVLVLQNMKAADVKVYKKVKKLLLGFNLKKFTVPLGLTKEEKDTIIPSSEELSEEDAKEIYNKPEWKPLPVSLKAEHIFLPGRVVYISRTRYAEKHLFGIPTHRNIVYDVFESNIKSFEDILISRNIFSDHFPNKYEEVFNELTVLNGIQKEATSSVLPRESFNQKIEAEKELKETWSQTAVRIGVTPAKMMTGAVHKVTGRK